MNESEKCPKCGGKMDPGKAHFYGSPGFKSADQKWLSNPTRIDRAKACLECGYVELYVDPLKLRKNINRAR